MNELACALHGEAGQAGGCVDEVPERAAHHVAGILRDFVSAGGEFGHGVAQVSGSLPLPRCAGARRRVDGVCRFRFAFRRGGLIPLDKAGVVRCVRHEIRLPRLAGPLLG